jgi:hypothetical protein
VSRAAHQPRELRRWPFLGRTAVATGLLTPDQLRSSAWRRLCQGVYVHASVPVTHAVRTVGASLLLPEAVVTGRSAAVLWGVDLATASDDVELTLPSTGHPRRLAGVTVRRALVPTEHRARRLDVPVTTAAATAVRLAGLLDGDEAVIAVDRILATRAADLAEVRRLAADARGRGSVRARRVCQMADGLAESPQETRVRLLMARGGLPPPVAQYRVHDPRGSFVARVDFGWPQRRVAVEYDGLWHAEDEQFAKDRRRLNRLREVGWTVVFVTAADLRDPDRLVARIAAALAI